MQYLRFAKGHSVTVPFLTAHSGRAGPAEHRAGDARAGLQALRQPLGLDRRRVGARAGAFAGRSGWLSALDSSA